jgi:protein-tyrosine phosphatase
MTDTHVHAMKRADTFPPEHYARLLINKGFTTVVRLNEASTYDPKSFTDAGLKHYDMFFEDCSVPKNSMLADFFRLCTQSERIAVHCRAGLGRTGTLIAASLIKFHGFTAAESIAWARIVRPGSVMGYQQQYLQFIEGVFRIQVPVSSALQPAQAPPPPPPVASSATSRARNALTSSHTLSAPHKPRPFSSLTDMKPASQSMTLFSSMRDLSKLSRETSNSSQDEEASGTKTHSNVSDNKALSKDEGKGGSHIYARNGSESNEAPNAKRDQERPPATAPAPAPAPAPKIGVRVLERAGSHSNSSVEDADECDGCAEQERLLCMQSVDCAQASADEALSLAESLFDATDAPISMSALSLWPKEKDKENVDRATRAQMILASQEKRIARRLMMQEKAKRA